MVLRLVPSDVGFVGVVAEVQVVALEEVILRAVIVRVLGSVWLFRIDFVSGGTTQACDL